MTNEQQAVSFAFYNLPMIFYAAKNQPTDYVPNYQALIVQQKCERIL